MIFAVHVARKPGNPLAQLHDFDCPGGQPMQWQFLSRGLVAGKVGEGRQGDVCLRATSPAFFCLWQKVPPSVTQEQLDTLITEWQQKIAVATENLLALDDTLAMKRIEGRDGFSMQPLSGATARRVLPSLVVMRDLFGQVGTLSDIVERASRMRRSLNRLWRYQETLAEIELLLTGASIPLPELKTPLAERNLLSSSTNTRAITPERLLRAMTDAFATARDAVLSVEAAWQRWEPMLDALNHKEATLRQQADALDVPVPAELLEARYTLQSLQEQVQSDPLGVSGNSDRVAALLSAARDAIEYARRQREAVCASLLTARALLEELARQEEAVTSSFARCHNALDASAQPQSGVGLMRLQQLEAWLVSLEEAAGDKRWQAAQVGLERWMQAAQNTGSALADAERTNQSLLDLPSELQGRHAVLRARMQKLGSRDLTLERLSLQALTLLDEPRLPVQRATKLIEACEERLRRDKKQ